MKIETSSKTTEIRAIIEAALDADERVQAAIQARDSLHDKHRRLQAGIVALQADLEKTEAAIQADRLSLADGSPVDVVEVNKRIANAMSLIQTTNESITAMTAQIEAMRRDLRYADEAVGSVITTIVNQKFFDGFQAQVDALVGQAIALIQGYNQAVSQAIVERDGRTAPSYRPHRLALGDGIDLQHHVNNPIRATRTLHATPARQAEPAHAPSAPAAGRLGSFRG